jgi:hypothetical protein
MLQFFKDVPFSEDVVEGCDFQGVTGLTETG